MQLEKPDPEVLAIRCHDITTSLRGQQVPEFDQLIIIGMAVRLALHLRGIPAVPYELLKQIGSIMLHIPSMAMGRVIETLGNADFVKISQTGKTINSIVPTIPYYEDLFSGLGKLATTDDSFSESEWMSIMLVNRLAKGPVYHSTLYGSVGEKRLVDRTLAVGTQGGYLMPQRARGRDLLISPVYFPENGPEFADLAAGEGPERVAKVVSLLAHNQGWPLALIEKQGQIGEVILTPEEIKIMRMVAGTGLAPTPAIDTTHHGRNYFVFAPKPGALRIAPAKRMLYENAMAVLASVRQGQLLPGDVRIRNPKHVLRALRDRKYVRANTDAYEQYHALALLQIGRLVPTGGRFFEFHVNEERPENIETLDLALSLLEDGEPPPRADEQVLLAFHEGQEYVDTLAARHGLIAEDKVVIDPQSKQEIEDLFLRGVK